MTGWRNAIRHYRPVLWGAVPGFALGLYMGYTSSQGGLESLTGPIFSLAAAGLLFVGLLIAAARATEMQSGPLGIAAAAVLLAGFLGFIVAPDAPGSRQRAVGTGTAGTRADPAALWSGEVSCEWFKDESSGVGWVSGFWVPITDHAFLAANRMLDDDTRATVVQVEGGTVHVVARGSGDALDLPVDVESVSSDGRSGTAVLTGVGVVFHWSCERGP